MKRDSMWVVSLGIKCIKKSVFRKSYLHSIYGQGQGGYVPGNNCRFVSLAPLLLLEGFYQSFDGLEDFNAWFQRLSNILRTASSNYDRVFYEWKPLTTISSIIIFYRIQNTLRRLLSEGNIYFYKLLLTST